MKQLRVVLLFFLLPYIANAQWQQTSCPLGTGDGVLSLGANGSYVFAGVDGLGVRVSSNNGTSWSSANIGITSNYITSFTVKGSDVFTGTDAGIFRSGNNGSSWSAVNNGLTTTFIASLAGEGFKFDSTSNKSFKILMVDNQGNVVNSNSEDNYEEPTDDPLLPCEGIDIPIWTHGNYIYGNKRFYVGTCNNKSVSFITNHEIRMNLSNNGNFGIGTFPNGYNKLEVKGKVLIRGLNGSLFFGEDDENAPTHNGQWGIEYEDNLGGLNFWKPAASNGFGNYFLFLKDNGNVGIGTGTPNYKLDVCGTIHSSEWIVESPWWDSKFNPGYNRMSWQDKLDYITTHKHLPEIESESVIKENGLYVAATMRGFVYNIEDNTLDIIDLFKENQIITEKIKVLEQENSVLKKLLYELESRIKQIETEQQ